MAPKKLALIAITALLVGCSITPEEEAAAVAKGDLPDVPLEWTAVQDSVGDVQVGWIDALGDETLSALVREAQANNRNLQGAAANVERSWALAKQAGASLKPRLDAVAGLGGSGVLDGPTGGSSSSQINLGLQATWELDVWGRIRASKQASVLSAEAAEADYVFSQYSLASATARAYFLAVEAGLQADVVQKSLDALKEANRITQVKFDNGIADAQALSISKSDLATAESSLASAQSAQREAMRALEVLLGRYPSADVDLGLELPETPPLPPAGVPSEILERRPDIIAAERNVAAAFNQLDSAKAARLPALSLTTSIGGASSDLSEVLDPTNVAWNVASNLLAPIFDGGSRQAQVDIETAEQKQALAAYSEAALKAFQEVENSLDQNVVLKERYGFLDQAAVESNKAFGIAKLRYEEGETELLDMLSIQERVFNAESNLVAVERARLDQWVGLNLALGGDWDSPPPPTPSE